MRQIRVTITIDKNVGHSALAQVADSFLGHAADEEKWLKVEGILPEDASLEVTSNASDLEYRNGSFTNLPCKGEYPDFATGDAVFHSLYGEGEVIQWVDEGHLLVSYEKRFFRVTGLAEINRVE